MYVLMEHRSPERRGTITGAHQQERHRQPMLRARTVVHSSAPKEAAIQVRHKIVPAMSSSMSAGEEKSGQRGGAQLRRRQLPQAQPRNGPAPSGTAIAPALVGSPKVAYRQIRTNNVGPRPLAMSASVVLEGPVARAPSWKGPMLRSPQLVHRHVRYSSRVGPAEEGGGGREAGTEAGLQIQKRQNGGAVREEKPKEWEERKEKAVGVEEGKGLARGRLLEEGDWMEEGKINGYEK